MRSLAQIELDIENLQSRRSAICVEKTYCDDAQSATLLKELTKIDAKLKRRFDRRTLLRAQRNASGVMWLGDYSRS
jgi:hypothetical protein